ncbi:MAG: hypothetical protein J6I65_07955 [Lachnospiraceae bacterium]|nr:hypothetical protein [Lachnospiraceae bacterium]
MAKSIMQEDDNYCYLCGANGTCDLLHWHHVFGGPNRKHSEKYGLKVRLCGQKCHENGSNAVHRNRKVDLELKAAGQRAFEEVHGSREDFMRIFGKNYL